MSYLSSKSVDGGVVWHPEAALCFGGWRRALIYRETSLGLEVVFSEGISS